MATPAARSCSDLAGSLIQHIPPAATDEHMCAVRGKTYRHFLAEAGSASRHQDALSVE